MVIKRGEIWWASLGEPRIGSEPGYRRPILVLQANPFNESKIQTVVVAIITSNLRLEAAPGNCLLKKRESQLSRDSVINLSQIITVNKSCLTDKVSKLSSSTMSDVNTGVCLVLGLPSSLKVEEE